MNQIEILEKIATILNRTEVFIQSNGDQYLPLKRSLFIDMATLSMAELEDDFIDYDRIKCIVTNMVNTHLSGHSKWFVDMTQTNEKEVVLIDDSSYERLTIPAPLYLSMSLPHVLTDARSA